MIAVNKLKIYVSGALTGIEKPAKVKAFYEAIGKLCEQVGFQAYVPHLKTDPIANADALPRQVFETDKHQVSTSQLVIAYLGTTSFGVGMELAYAEVNKIPIIILYEQGKIISRFVLGIPTVIEQIQFENYEDALIRLKVVLEQRQSKYIKQF